MANTEIQFLKKQIKQLHDDMAALIAILIQLKVLKIKIDENGNAIYDAGNDDKPEVQ